MKNKFTKKVKINLVKMKIQKIGFLNYFKIVQKNKNQLPDL